MKNIRTILFDLGNVLAYIDFDAFWRSLGFYNALDKAPFVQGYKKWTLRYETGYIPTNEYLNRLQSVFHGRFSTDQLEQAFARILLAPVDGMFEIVRLVSRKHRTALVSNTNEIHYKLSSRKYEVLSILSRHYVSYRLQVMKPAPEFYAAIIKDQKCDPSEMLFVDDLESNVEGARSAGMQAIRFEGVEELESYFKKLL